MTSRKSTLWLMRLATFLAWMLVALSCVFWGLKFIHQKPISANAARIVPQLTIDSPSVARLLGYKGSDVQNVLAGNTITNHILFGVVNTPSGGGVALISSDGKPAKPYRVGVKVGDDWVLKSLSAKEAVLAKGLTDADAIKLTLPVKLPATGGVAGLATAQIIPSQVTGSMTGQIPNTPRIPLQPPVGRENNAFPTATSSLGQSDSATATTNPNATGDKLNSMGRAVSRFAPKEQTDERSSITTGSQAASTSATVTGTSGR